MVAVLQVRLTSLFAGSPAPEIVVGVPATAMSGVVLSVSIVAAGLPGSTSGPGKAETPGTAGAATGPGVASARPGTSSAMSATAMPTTRLVEVVMVGGPF